MRKRCLPGVLLGWFVLGALLAPLQAAHAYGAPLVRTPLVGRTWTTGASIWVGTADTYGDATSETLTLRVREESACETCWVETVEMGKQGTGAGFRSWKGSLLSLKPNTRYHYGIFAAGFTGERGGFYFKTEPEGPARFKVGLASCMNAETAPSQPSWNIMYEQLNTGEPNLQVLLGDNLYTTDHPASNSHYWFKYFQQRNVPQFAEVFRAIPTFAIWDDHDYGPNDEDQTYAQKDVAREAFADLWPHPPFAGAGIFHTFTWGGDANAVGGVEFFMMDDRWSRDCPKELPAGYAPRMYGDIQFDWLKTQLRASQATFKVIANGSTLNNACWGTQRKQLFDFIVANKIPGVLFATGDIHRSLVTSWAPAGGYPLWEVTSSGIGNPNGHGANPPEYSFAILEFDMTLADPTITVKVIKNPQKRTTITGAGVTVDRKVIRSSELRN